MEETECTRQGNRVDVEFQVRKEGLESYEVIKSREYVINGLVVFQIKMNISRKLLQNSKFFYNISVNITFRKTIKTDILTYAITCSGNNFKMDNPITLCTDETPWCQICEIDKNDDWYSTVQFKFNLTLEIDLQSSSSSPLASLHNDTDLTDFELRGKDGSVRVHKAILAGYSPVLQTMVAGDWREAKEGSVNVEGTTKETLKHLKDYMYNDKLPENGLEQLIVLASYYMMEDLVQKCSFKLLNTLTAQNALELADLAGTYKARHLLFGIMQNVKFDVITFENFANLSLAEKSANKDNTD